VTGCGSGPHDRGHGDDHGVWANRHEAGAVPSQTRAANGGNVNAVGGGFIPTQLKGGGVAEIGLPAADVGKGPAR
jgi:hypothetical protein